jgi:DNA-binding response OmpR family regulator
MEQFFSVRHYTVRLEDNGLHIVECLRDGAYDVVVLEIALPGLDGIGVVRVFRAAGGSTPILLMASRHCSDELQCGLDAGADAYLVKPFQLSDLDALLKALLRRPALRCDRVLVSGSIAMDTAARTVTRDDRVIHLHPMEFKLLQFLLRHPNQVFDARALFERVWQKGFGHMDDTVRTHVRTLRRKIDLAGSPSIITTVRGFGYKAENR